MIYTCLFLLTSTHDNTVVITIITPTSIIITVLTVTTTSTDMFLVSEDPVYCNEHKKLYEHLIITVMLCFFINNHITNNIYIHYYLIMYCASNKLIQIVIYWNKERDAHPETIWTTELGFEPM